MVRDELLLLAGRFRTTVELVDSGDDANLGERLDRGDDLGIRTDIGRHEHDQRRWVGGVEEPVDDLATCAANVRGQPRPKHVEAAAQIASGERVPLVAGGPKTQLVADG